MPDENEPNELKKGDGLKLALKVIGITIVVLLGIVVIGFGLLVGFCALASGRH
jgi:hypothetical protein